MRQEYLENPFSEGMDLDREARKLRALRQLLI